MMNTKEIRSKLKNYQPYYIEKELMPFLYYKEATKELEYWVFLYSFVRKLSDEAIGVRLGYNRKSVYNMALRIIENNLDLIVKFLHK